MLSHSVFKHAMLDNKVREKANISNRYNQVPHLTQDTIWECDKSTRKHHIQESQEANFELTKCLTEYQRGTTLIRLLLQKQSDLCLHCLSMPFCMQLVFEILHFLFSYSNNVRVLQARRVQPNARRNSQLNTGVDL